MGLFTPRVVRRYNEMGIVSGTMIRGEKESGQPIKRLTQWVSRNLIETPPSASSEESHDESALLRVDSEKEREEAFWRSREIWAAREWQNILDDSRDPTAPASERARKMLAKRVALTVWIEKNTKSGGA